MDLKCGEDPVQSYCATSQQIIETLQFIQEPAALTSNSSSTALEKVLYMIQSNLTFDDPGIFFGHCTQNISERTMQITFNVWLNNQLVYIICNAQSESLRKKVVELQQEILAASFLKQRWLFRLIFMNYSKLLLELVSDVQLHVLPYCVLSMKSNVLNPLSSSIEVKSSMIRDCLIVNCLKLLTHTVPLIVNSEDEMLEQCTESVYAVYLESSLHIKTLALQYFAKVFRRRIQPSDHLLRITHQLMQGIQKIRQQIPMWLHLEVISVKESERFISSVGYLLGIKGFAEHCKDSVNRRMATQMCSYLSRANQTEQERLMFGGKFMVVVSEFWKSVLGTNPFIGEKHDNNLINVFGESNRSSLEPEMVMLMQGWVCEWMFSGSEEHEVLKIVDDFTKWIVTVKIQSENQFIDQLRLINSLTTMLLSAEQEFQEWHQQQHILSTHEECPHCLSSQLTHEWDHIDVVDPPLKIKQTNQILSDRVHGISTGFLTFVDQHSGSLKSTESVFEISDVAWRLFGNQHSHNFSQNEQTRIFSLGMATLFERHALKNSFPFIYGILHRPIPNTVLRQFHEHLQTTILSSDLHTFTTTMKTTISAAFNRDCHEKLGPDMYQILLHFLLQDIISLPNMVDRIENDLDANTLFGQQALAKVLKSIICFCSGKFFVVSTKDTFNTTIQCVGCNPNVNLTGLLRMKRAESIPKYVCTLQIERIMPRLLSNLLDSDDTLVRLAAVDMLPALSRHFSILLFREPKWMTMVGDKSIEVQKRLSDVLPDILELVEQSETLSKGQKCRVQNELLVHLTEAVRTSLENRDGPRQVAVINTIRVFARQKSATEAVLLRLFLLTTFYMIRTESVEAKHAALCAFEIAAFANTNPRKIVCWNRERVFKLLVGGAVANFKQHGFGLNKTLTNFCYMLGYTSFHSTFVPHFSPTILAILLPYVVQYPRCQTLVDELCSLQNKSLPEVLSSAFLHIYPHLYLYQSAVTYEKCMKYVIQYSQHDLMYHLKTDSRRTLTEILIWYHRNPEFVMNTLRHLIVTPLSTTTTVAESSTSAPLTKIADYIATRFLGVLTNFGVILIANDLEKSLQSEMLHSLGDIIRFMGSQHITPFRFKIITVLRSALSIENNHEMRHICATVWKIFIYTVDVQSMGPLLSIIVVSLEPLIKTHQNIVNEILKYLIISNGNLLSMHIKDLFFIEQTKVFSEIKDVVAKHSKETIGFDRRFQLYVNQINHESIDVRIYALKFLTDLFDQNRQILNDQIIGQQQMNPLIEELLCTLLVGSKHVDRQLQLSSGKCLGKVGALEPSHLPPNYAPQKRFALSIHTDVFSIMALAELCRAYQFQKDTQRVDGFSLAIQEILLARGVCPEQKKKMDVWNAIPERMRQLMETLLKSCYTALPSNVSHNVHPIFEIGRFSTAESWASAWAYVLIEYVTDEETKHLLKSFKSSIRNDTGVLSMFLPYIVMHAVQTSSNENMLRIEQELQYVFDQVLLDENLELPIKCSKIAFNQLDFLGCWLRQFRTNYANATDPTFVRIVEFLSRFDPKCLATANFKCGEHARALQYLETYIEGDRERRFQSELSFLAQIYAELLDSDSLEGALNMKLIKPTLCEQVLLNNATGRLQDSTVCFEQMMQHGDMTETNVGDMIQCYLGLDQPETALMVSQALMKQMYDQQVPPSIVAACAEPLWRLGRFEELDDLLGNAKLRDKPDWGIRCGQVMLALRKGHTGEFSDQIDKCRLSVLQQLRTHDGDERSSYDKVYPLMLRLHQIAEIEMCQSTVDEVLGASSPEQANRLLSSLFDEWDARMDLLQPTARTLEPVLCLRRILLNESKTLIGRGLNVDLGGKRELHSIVTTSTKTIDNYIGRSLMKSTELARSAEMFQQAKLFILNAESYSPVELFIEKAKLSWRKGDQMASLSILERGIEELCQKWPVIERRCEAIKNAYSEAKFLVATYNADAMNTNTMLNIKYFKEAMKAAGDSEKSYVFYAQYSEKVFAALSQSEQMGSKGNELQQEIMTCYGKSMLYGSRYIYQSMPRFLAIWLDFTARLETNDGYKKVSANMNKIVDRFAESLPPFVFFTAFSQLVSRICHPSAEVYQVLRTIIIKLIISFPQQSMWMIMSVYKSSYASRVRRCTEVFSDKRLSSTSLVKLINDFNLLAERMIELTNKPVTGTPQLTVNDFYRQLPALLETPGFSSIIMPTNKYMLPVLPSATQRDRSGASFNAFPNQAIYIHRCGNELVVMPSLQKPKRMKLIGNDGCEYMIMMKPKDDLRKDFRLMEFNAIVNRYLRLDPETRQRRLYIRTYAVLPLNEECGILEWVDHLQPLRPIVNELLKRKSLGMSTRALREVYRNATTPKSKRDVLVDILLVNHPPVLAEWFKERFTTAHNWYLARSSYIRTTAVISVVGYILGLGDRHGENILFDTSNGDTVHVDFNCLFNKGECFEVPELVPFRLTHNMVNAMGPLGVEGLYRRCSQITMRVLQEQMSTLMSVLRPFVYDPLVSWNRLNKADGRQERTDQLAITNVKRIEERLKGYVKLNGVISSMALSAEGVVNHCISEATDLDKLAVMYIGWGPYI